MGSPQGEKNRAAQMPFPSRLSAAMEDYLEAVAALMHPSKGVRVKELAAYLQVTMPTVSQALKLLQRAGLITHERYGAVHLTTGGAKVAQDVQRRHQILYDFLSQVLKLDSDVADADACKMEHVVSRTTLNRLVEFVTQCSPRQEGDTCV